jgi:hypothetical protein
MKNVTLSAEEALIEQARLVAKTQHKTLNAASSACALVRPVHAG